MATTETKTRTATKAPKTLSTADLAEQLNTDPRTLRRFLRSGTVETITPVGQGKRYAIEPRTARTLKKAFEAWTHRQEVAQ